MTDPKPAAEPATRRTPGGSDAFRPELFTRTAVEGFLSKLEARGHGTSHRAKAKSAISSFATWLVEEKGLLRKNPARGTEVPASQVLAPRRLSPDQRYVHKNLVEGEGARGAPRSSPSATGPGAESPTSPG